MIGGSRTRSLDCGLQGKAVGRVDDRIIHGRHNRSQEAQELRGFDRSGVGCVDDILVPHLEGLREEVAGGIAQIHPIDHRNDRPLELIDIDANFSGYLPGLAAIEEHRTWISQPIVQAALLCNRLGKRDAPGVELELALGAGGAECDESFAVG